MMLIGMKKLTTLGRSKSRKRSRIVNVCKIEWMVFEDRVKIGSFEIRVLNFHIAIL